MIEKDYSNIPMTTWSVNDSNKTIRDTIIKYDKYCDIDFSNTQVHNVKSPFTIADNSFDLRESNNTIYELNADRIECVKFTGGSFLITYVVKDRSKLSMVVQGNDEEGFNIFILN